MEFPKKPLVAVATFLTWWALWSLADFLLEDLSPYPQALVIVATSAFLGVYVSLRRGKDEGLRTGEKESGGQ